MITSGQSPNDSWHEFAAAVAYVADVERPGLTIWEALAEALRAWMHDGGGRPIGGHAQVDALRPVLEHLLTSTPEAGAPGGTDVGSMVDAAMAMWSESASHRVNDGHKFASRSR